MSDGPVYHSDSGITEGVAPVPRWYLLAVALLGLSFVIYLGKYLVDAQMSTARMKKDTPAAAPEQPGDGAVDGATDGA
ncbi:MAG: hypothetical protein AB7T63_07160 [Planctomycetota bacterium]